MGYHTGYHVCYHVCYILCYRVCYIVCYHVCYIVCYYVCYIVCYHVGRVMYAGLGNILRRLAVGTVLSIFGHLIRRDAWGFPFLAVRRTIRSQAGRHITVPEEHVFGRRRGPRSSPAQKDPVQLHQPWRLPSRLK